MKKAKKITIHYPYTPNYNMVFLDQLLQISDHDYILYTDKRSSDGIEFGNVNSDLTVREAPIRKLSGIWFSTNLVSHLLRDRPDVFVVNGNPRDLGTFLVMLIGIFTRTKIVAWGMFHRIGEPRLVTTFYFWLCGVLCDANFTYARIGKISQVARGTRSSKIHVIGTAIADRNSVGEVTFGDKLRVINELGLDSFLNSGDFVILQVMRLSSIKKPELLMELMSKLASNDKNIKLVLAGGGPLEDWFKAKVLDAGLTGSIALLGPIYDSEKLAILYDIADVTVVPTCIGLTAHQSLSYNVPVITDNSVTNQASEFEILVNGYNSVIYEEGDISELSEIIESLFDDRDFLNHLKSNCTVSLEQHSIRKKALRFLRAIKTL
tara:strand:- start:81 stop:1214 length:1134 start_codon:yes stop_codon:yes gene_type:complete